METTTSSTRVDLTKDELQMIVEALRGFEPVPEDMPAFFSRALEGIGLCSPFENSEQREAKMVRLRKELMASIEKEDANRIHLMSKLLSLKEL